MSEATNNGLLVLTAINGAMMVIDGHRLFSRVDMKELVRQTAKQAEHAINNWGETGNGFNNTAWLVGVFTEWDNHCFPETTKFRADILVAACGMLLTDLEDKLNDRNKKRLLKPLVESVAVMQEFTDCNWLNFPALDEAKRVAEKLYAIAKENEGVTFKVIRAREIKVVVKGGGYRQKLRELDRVYMPQAAGFCF